MLFSICRSRLINEGFRSFLGAATIIGSPLAGAVYDATNSYDIPFYMAAGFFALSTITSFAAPAMKRCVLRIDSRSIENDLIGIIFCSFAKPQQVPVHVETLTPIDEAAEDMDDQPITMVPKIVKTAPSPQSETSPGLSAITSRSTVNPAEKEHARKEINQIESVL